MKNRKQGETDIVHLCLYSLAEKCTLTTLACLSISLAVTFIHLYLKYISHTVHDDVCRGASSIVYYVPFTIS